ncbi:LPS-assembly protein LptD [Flavobacterium sp. CYK-4]|uniref:putative LPS assembly protein LptD n=1 Tax=Flavobacterium lotistagni TaxID=2709660 RepID=UPI00140CA106|nr:LPS-assembly protein LptD [Flavobacterium lotistagni]
MYLFLTKFFWAVGASEISHIFTKIALKPLRTNLFHIVFSAFFLTIGITKNYAQELNNQSVKIPVQKQADSTKINIADLTKIGDSIKSDSVKPKKPILESKIKYKAEKYAKIDNKKKLITLYDKAELYYQDIELKAGIIVFNYDKSEVYAGRIKDSLGNYTQYPNFKQGSNAVEPDSIRFNYKTKKALIWNSRTEQGEFKVKAEVSKRVNDSVYFLKNARFTTAEDIEDPEYYFRTSRLKFVPKKKVVTGLTNMVIADVPTPLALPFAFFPMTETSQSGIIVPTFNDNNDRGYSLQNGGYYLALSKYYDLAILGDYFTNGSYALRFESSYALKYKFRGNFNVRYENLINSERGFPDYSKTNIYNIQWSHSQDGKANPNSRFSASVNFGSSKYFRQSASQLNVGSNLNNTLSSSISYSKTFNTIPQANLSLTATHSQNTNTEQINMTLPTLQFSVDRVFPFAPKEGIKKGFFKNINLQYNLRSENRIATTDSLFFKPEMFKNAKLGFQHSIPLSTNFKVFKYFSATTSMNFEEVWYLKTIRKSFDVVTNQEVVSEVNKFDAFRTYSFSSSLGTTIYGTFKFGDTKKIQAIRHVMRPSVSYSYTPSFKQYYDTYAADGSGTMVKEYTRFEQGIFGAPGKNLSSNVGFSLSNTFEAKVTDKDTTKTEPKKVMLLNNLNLSTSYDITADSLHWAPLRVSGGTALFNNKMNVNFGMTLNPYAIDNAGRTFEKFNIDNGGSLFRMTSANMTLNYSLSSRDGETNKNKNKNTQGLRNGGRDDDLFGTNTDFSDRRQTQFGNDDSEEEDNFKGFFKSEVPWDINLAYQLTYTNIKREKQISGNSLMMSLNTELSKNWKVGVSSGYDFVQDGVTFTQFRFERNLMSWRMDFSWTPFGANAFWSFFIGIKSSMLSDIKWEKRTLPDRVLR